jgi:hypothetical protein
VDQTSDTLGCNLLEWYYGLEVHYRPYLGDEILLPQTWREENAKVRKELANLGYPHLISDERKKRMIIDLCQKAENSSIELLKKSLSVVWSMRGAELFKNGFEHWKKSPFKDEEMFDFRGY